MDLEKAFEGGELCRRKKKSVHRSSGKGRGEKKGGKYAGGPPGVRERRCEERRRNVGCRRTPRYFDRVFPGKKRKGDHEFNITHPSA